MAAGTEGGAAGLAAEGLNALVLSMGPIADQGVDLRIRNLIVHTGGAEAGEALSGNAFGRSPPAFKLEPWTHGETCWDMVRIGSWVPTDGAIVRGAWLEQPLHGRGRGRRTYFWLTATPGAHAPDETHDDQQHEPVYVYSHTVLARQI